MGQNTKITNMLSAAGLVAFMAGCASPGDYSATPPPRPLGAEYTAVGTKREMATEPAHAVLVPDVLQLTDALALALMGNPELVAFSYEVRAAETLVLQAGVLPNPELELGIEEFDRGGEGFDSAETSVTLGQLFELGSKRRWRTRVAEAEGELAGWDYESTRMDVFTETARRFTEVIAAQERLELSRSMVGLAEKTSQAVAERIKAGKEPPLQAAKSEAELEMARLDAQGAENAQEVARRNLAAMWSAERAEFQDARGKIDQILQVIPTLEELRPRLALNPDLARWKAELDLRQAMLCSEKAARIPDLKGSVGYLQFEEDGTDALAFGIAVPLPLFDRNQRNIEAATHRLSKAKAMGAVVEVTLAVELAAAHAALMISHQRVTALSGKVIPAMEQTYQAVHEGYTQGKFGFLEVLDAQRGLFEAKAALLDTQNGYQRAVIDIQRLTGTDMQKLTNEKAKE